MSLRRLQEVGQAKGTRAHEHRTRLLAGRPASAASKPLLLSLRESSSKSHACPYAASKKKGKRKGRGHVSIAHAFRSVDPQAPPRSRCCCHFASFLASLMHVATPPPRRRATEKVGRMGKDIKAILTCISEEMDSWPPERGPGRKLSTMSIYMIS